MTASKQSGFFLLFVVLSLGSLMAEELDPYVVLDACLDGKKDPRVLNAQDLASGTSDLRSTTVVEGDFNADGQADLAVSGIYGFPEHDTRYFVVVATANAVQNHCHPLFFEEYKQPAFLHKPGTTGSGDTGQQAFSLSFCSACTQGWDFFWRKNRFVRDAWREHRAPPPASPPKLPEPTEAELNVALKVVSALPDVDLFVKETQKAGNKLGTRAHYSDSTKKTVVIEVIKRSGPDEEIYDRISVNVKKKSVEKRERKF